MISLRAARSAMTHIGEDATVLAHGLADDTAQSVLDAGLTLRRQPAHPNPFVPIGETRLSPDQVAAGMLDDASGLERGIPDELIRPQTEADIVDAYELARSSGRPVVMSGARHSMGGQNVVDGAIHLDMTSFNRMTYDAKTGSLFVQPGATWADIQRYLDPMGRSPRVQQSSNIFTVGGSLAADIHGRDVRFGPIAESVRSLALLKPNGERIIASPTQNADLFRATIGGYGLTGTVTEVELSTVANEQFRRVTHNIKTHEFTDWYAKNMEGNPDARFMQARVSPTNLEDMHVITFEAAEASGPLKPVVHKKPGLLTPLVGLPYKATMKSKVAKRLAWVAYRYGDNNVVGRLFSKTTRNQVMSVPLEFLRSRSTKHTQVLQEYFVPHDRLGGFLDDLRGVINEHDANVLTITVRKVPKDTNAMLAVSPEDSFAVMTYMDQKLAPGAQQAWDAYAQAADAAVVAHGGRPYIAYRNAATPEQLLAGYPELPAFIQTVHGADPEGLISHKLKGALQAAAAAGGVQ